tara:strand:- start:399 stop:1037 length:639 start_codon:yes stop_codon:yes gene_type:complete
MPHLDDINSTNLDEIRPLINNLDYVMFFGTLLGFVRNDSIIQDDDDIDFALNYSDRNSLINILENSNNFEILTNKEFYVSCSNKNFNEPNSIDFYIFKKENEKIIFPFSFYGNCKYRKRHDLYFDSALFYETELNQYNLKIPSESSKLMEKLYGKKYKTPLRKNIDYFIYFRRNEPIVTYNKKLVKFLLILRVLIEKRYKYAFRLIKSIFIS